MDTNKIYKLTVRMPKELRENLIYASNKLNITSNTFMKISLYAYLNLSFFNLAYTTSFNISEIPKERNARLSLIVDDELHTILEMHAQKYNLTINDLILYTILVSLNAYDESVRNNINNFQSRLKIAIKNKGISQAELARRSGLERVTSVKFKICQKNLQLSSVMQKSNWEGRKITIWDYNNFLCMKSVIYAEIFERKEE